MNNLLKEFENETGITRNTSREFLERYAEWLENRVKELENYIFNLAEQEEMKEL
jgi:hypothetical protein